MFKMRLSINIRTSLYVRNSGISIVWMWQNSKDMYDCAFGALPKDLQRECVSLPDEAAPQ